MSLVKHGNYTVGIFEEIVGKLSKAVHPGHVPYFHSTHLASGPTDILKLLEVDTYR